MNNHHEIDLIDYLRLMLKGKNTILFCLLLTFLIMLALNTFIFPGYEAQATISLAFIRNPVISKSEMISIPLRKQLFEEYAASLKNSINYKQMIALRDRGSIKIEDLLYTDNIRIKVRDKDQQRAIRICNLVSNCIIDSGNKIFYRKIYLLEEQLTNYQEEKRAILDSLLSSSLKNNPDDNYIFLLESIVATKNLLKDSREFKLKGPVECLRRKAAFGISQLAAILILGLLIGIILVFLQNFWRINFSKDR